MDDSFFGRPILNSPYAYPAHHWELDADGIIAATPICSVPDQPRIDVNVINYLGDEVMKVFSVR